MEEDIKQLGRLTDELLSADYPGELRTAAFGLHELCSRITGMEENSMEAADTTPTRLSSGVAIDPLSAARCTQDYARTTAFLRGVCRAVQVAQQRFPAQTIELLYAGCGPFAPLAIPLMTRFSANEVQFTLLDIHQRSLDCARRLVEAFGFSAHVRAFVEADAAVYQAPSPSHIVVTETMQRALIKEPQVAITLTLAPQLCAGGIFIPERITVDACLYDPKSEFQTASSTDDKMPERVRVMLGRLMELDLDSVPRLRAEGFPVVRVRWPADGVHRLPLMFRTQVTVFESLTLGDYASGITCPHPWNEGELPGPGGEAGFRYELGSVPGVRQVP